MPGPGQRLNRSPGLGSGYSQRACYDSNSNYVACDSPELIGRDGYYQLGCPRQNRFIDNGHGTVTDGCPMLQCPELRPNQEDTPLPLGALGLPESIRPIRC